MTSPRVLLLSFSLAAAACAGTNTPDIDRKPIGKADLAGSCVGTVCAGPSELGNCWCDERCTEVGDCCSDREEVCGFECPHLTPPSPAFCPNGTTTARLDEFTGCTVGYDCTACPELTPPSPALCPNGTFKPTVDEGTGCTVGFDCIVCPDVSLPPPELCPTGTFKPTVDQATGCTTGYVCE